jgi:hypothetical protein
MGLERTSNESVTDLRISAIFVSAPYVQNVSTAEVS